MDGLVRCLRTGGSQKSLGLGAGIFAGGSVPYYMPWTKSKVACLMQKILLVVGHMVVSQDEMKHGSGICDGLCHQGNNTFWKE